VDTALVVPFTPGLRPSSNKARTINEDEIDYFESTMAIPRPLRGVILMADRGSMAGLTSVNGQRLQANGKDAQSQMGAFYDSCKQGVFLCKDAPAWMVNAVRPNEDTQNMIQKPVPTNHNPGNPNQNNQVPPVPIDTQLWKAYAQSLYLQEVLRYRQARIGGKLRFDISPGSVVTVGVPEDKFVQTGARYVYGTVIRTTVTINAEAQKAGTAFQIGFVRDDSENTDPDFSTDKHPMWANSFDGAPLSKQIPFP
jgi:hypothetical protein